MHDRSMAVSPQNSVVSELVRLFAMPSTVQSMERSIAAQNQSGQRIEGKVNALTQILEKIEARLREATSEITSTLIEVSRRVGNLAEKSACLEDASRQQALLQERHYEEHVIEPLCGQLFPLFDLFDNPVLEENGTNGELASAARSQILELLACYGVEPIQHVEGSRFDASLMKPMRIDAAPQAERDRAVSCSLQCGFRRGERILRHEGVAVYRFIPSKKEGDS